MDKSSTKKILFILGIIIIAVIVVVINFKMPVSASQIKMDVYEDKYKFKGIFIMQEYAVYHGDVNSSKMYIKPGEKASKGSVITYGVISPESGLVALNYDGWENKYNLNNIKNINVKDIDNILKGNVKENGIKVINNSEWYICSYVTAEVSAGLKKGSQRDILIGDNYYSIVVEDKFKNSDGNFIVMKMMDDPDFKDLHRGVTGYIIRARYKGFVIPSDSITKYNGNEGVFIKSNGYAEIRLVNVLFKNDNTAVVIPLPNALNKLSEYDMVIRNASHISNGAKVR